MVRKTLSFTYEFSFYIKARKSLSANEQYLKSSSINIYILFKDALEVIPNFEMIQKQKKLADWKSDNQEKFQFEATAFKDHFNTNKTFSYFGYVKTGFNCSVLGWCLLEGCFTQWNGFITIMIIN